MRGKFSRQEERRLTGGIIEMDVHGMNGLQAYEAIGKQIRAVGNSVYRIRVIHGFHGGTRIRSMIREEFGYEREPLVKRIEMGTNQGITELVLREF